ncbi:four helix bundle protein [Methylophaga sp.]|uniref:four helix bundle protein n=1 Tax=Methylophaga sp. TaxID=2024840 RepID=UPI0013FEED30|nr:four helix bundle protein [Methylophaga sp.]MTI64692.1 four helix bundle protein [Methylophaga sp.]
MTKPHERLDAWIYSMQLVKEIYKMTAGFPAEERFGLTSQMRRAAVSIPSNIAEGAARSGAREFAYHLSVARGSLSELETQTKLAEMLGYVIKTGHTDELFDRVGKLLTGLHKKWNKA